MDLVKSLIIFIAVFEGKQKIGRVCRKLVRTKLGYAVFSLIFMGAYNLMEFELEFNEENVTILDSIDHWISTDC